jgi:hypothetical protein
MGKFRDLRLQRFGRLVALEYENAKWLCLCDCGTQLYVPAIRLTSGKTKSCGCYRKDVVTNNNYRHGLTRRDEHHRFAKTWFAMINRCHNEDHPTYSKYGRKGIAVCDEWRNLEVFCEWCDTQEPIPEGYTLDRKNNKEGYNPENCHFVSNNQQARNKSTNVWFEYNGERLIQRDFVKKYGNVSERTFRERIQKGIGPFEAATTPTSRPRHPKT